MHRSPDFDLIKPATRQGIRVTDPARVVLDLYAGERNPEVARRGLFSARKKKLVTWDELAECLESHARHGRRGITRLRADLELYSRSGCPETTFEDRIREVLVASGLPEPTLQHLAIAGWIIIHVTWAQVDDDPAGVVRLVDQAFSKRGGVAA